MTLDAATRPPGGMFAGRFFLIGYLPTVTAAVFVLLLLWAGAPAGTPQFRKAWRTAAGLSAGQILLLVLVVTLIALLMHPLQVPLVRLLEGYWPRWAAPVTTWGTARQQRRERRLRQRTELPSGRRPDKRQIRRAGNATTAFRTAFPASPELLRPTALGNVVASLEERAGGAYSWDTPVAWPRLYPLLGTEVRAIVDDRRDLLDALCRTAVTAAAAAAVSAGLLVTSRWWLLLAAAPLAIAWLAYYAAIHAAKAFGQAVRVAFDLHRFALYPTLHVPLPEDADAERAINQALCTFWRQGDDPRLPYLHTASGPADGSDGAGTGQAATPDGLQISDA